jgi:hypothetical protein
MDKPQEKPIPKIPKIPNIYSCKKCDYNTCNKKDFRKHEETQKHKLLQNPNYSYTKNPTQIFDCKCGKTYKHGSTLSSHKKKCNIINTNLIENDKINIFVKTIESEPIINKNPDIVELLINENKEFKNVIIDLVKNNQDLQKQMLEVCQKIQPITTNNVNNHSNNKTFNLNFFLNEQCKDAMNIMEFVDTFQLQFSDLERVGELGYVEGISSIIIDKLNNMDIYKRPIHCTDAKREIMHIKDNDVWAKDTENNDKLRLALKHITKKNMDLIGQWVEKHPGVRDYDHRLNDTYTIIIIESMGGKNNSTMHEGESKIIKKISKMVLIDKNMK